MSLFGFVAKMKESDSVVALIGILLLSFFLIVIILKMLFGMRRGTWRQLIRTGLTAVSAIASYIFACVVSDKILGSTDMAKIEDLIVKIESKIPESGEFLRKFLLSFEVGVFESIMLLPATLILVPILATVLFLFINLILKIVRVILVKVLDIEKAKNNHQKLCGTLLAAVEAIIWLIMVSLPITGVVGLVNRAYDASVSSRYADENVELKRIHNEYLSPFTDNPAFTFMDKMGSGAMSDGIATVEINGQDVNLRNEVVTITSIVMAETTTFKNTDRDNLSAECKEGIENIIGGVCNSPYLTTVVSGSLRNAGVLLDLDIIKYDEGSEFAGIIDGFVGYLKTITNETLYEDLTTMKELYFVISDSGAISVLVDGDADLWTVLQDRRKEGNDAISKLIDILQSNERTSGLIKTITEALIASLATQIETPDGTVVTVTYDELKDGMTDVLAVKQEPGQSREEYMENLSTTLDNTLTEHGIKLEYEIVDSIAEYIDENYSNKEEFTDEEFNDVLLHYYDAYLEYLETGEVPDDLPEDVIPDEDEGENEGNQGENDGDQGENEDNQGGQIYPIGGMEGIGDKVIYIPHPGEDNYDEKIDILVESLILDYPDGIPQEMFEFLPQDAIDRLTEFGYGPNN